MAALEPACRTKIILDLGQFGGIGRPRNGPLYEEKSRSVAVWRYRRTFAGRLNR